MAAGSDISDIFRDKHNVSQRTHTCFENVNKREFYLSPLGPPSTGGESNKLFNCFFLLLFTDRQTLEMKLNEHLPLF